MNSFTNHFYSVVRCVALLGITLLNFNLVSAQISYSIEEKEVTHFTPAEEDTVEDNIIVKQLRGLAQLASHDSYMIQDPVIPSDSIPNPAPSSPRGSFVIPLQKYEASPLSEMDCSLGENQYIDELDHAEYRRRERATACLLRIMNAGLARKLLVALSDPQESPEFLQRARYIATMSIGQRVQCNVERTLMQTLSQVVNGFSDYFAMSGQLCMPYQVAESDTAYSYILDLTGVERIAREVGAEAWHLPVSDIYTRSYRPRASLVGEAYCSAIDRNGRQSLAPEPALEEEVYCNPLRDTNYTSSFGAEHAQSKCFFHADHIRPGAISVVDIVLSASAPVRSFCDSENTSLTFGLQTTHVAACQELSRRLGLSIHEKTYSYFGGSCLESYETFLIANPHQALITYFQPQIRVPNSVTINFQDASVEGEVVNVNQANLLPLSLFASDSPTSEIDISHSGGTNRAIEKLPNDFVSFDNLTSGETYRLVVTRQIQFNGVRTTVDFTLNSSTIPVKLLWVDETRFIIEFQLDQEQTSGEITFKMSWN